MSKNIYIGITLTIPTPKVASNQLSIIEDRAKKVLIIESAIVTSDKVNQSYRSLIGNAEGVKEAFKWLYENKLGSYSITDNGVILIN